MKRTTHFLRAIAAGLGAAGLALAATPPPPKAPAPPPLSPRFIQVRDRINTLFHHRNEPPPPPDPGANPFRPAGATVVAGVPTPTLPSNDLALLQQAIAPLKVSGTMEGESLYVVVNNRTYKKNDIIPSRAEGEMVYLRVSEITRNTLTLSLRNAEMTLKF